jgi:nucleoside-triphosphatase
MPIKGRIAITGRPGVGKTTLIERVLEGAAYSAGGMLTRETRVCGRRVGFAIVDVATGTEGVLAHVHQRVGPKVGRYTVNIESLEQTGIAAILDAVRTKELVVIDEIAPMELLCPAFAQAVEAALASDRALLISTHANSDHPLAHRVRRELTLFRVKLSNRDRLAIEVAEALRDTS